MKISEVCEQTGLTKRTVRFYIEKGLLSPETENRNGKDFRDFSEDDIRLLKAISVLRGLDISVDDIGLLIQGNVTAGEMLEKYKAESRRALADNERVYDILSEIKVKADDDIYAVAEKAEDLSNFSRLPQRDAEPDFSGFDELTSDEKQQAFERFHNELVKKNAVSDYKMKILKRLLIIAGAALAVFIIIFGISWIPSGVDIRFDGYITDEITGERYPDTLTLKGDIFKPLLFHDFFSGSISFEKTSDLNITTGSYIVPQSKEYLVYKDHPTALYSDMTDGLFDDPDSYDLSIHLPGKNDTYIELTVSGKSGQAYFRYEEYEEILTNGYTDPETVKRIIFSES